MVNSASISDKMQGYLTPVRRLAMLAKIDTLPCAKRGYPAGYRDRKAHPCQDRFEVSGHIVGPFVIMSIACAFRRDAIEPAQDVAAHFGRRVFLNA